MNIQKVFDDFRQKPGRYQKFLTKFGRDLKGIQVETLEQFRALIDQIQVKDDGKDDGIVVRGNARAREIDEASRRKKFHDHLYFDFGCSDGKLTLEIAKQLKIPTENVYGADMASFTGVRINPVLHKQNFVLIEKEGQKLPYNDQTFGLVTCFQVLHHLQFPELAIAEFRRILRKDGMLIIREHDARDEDKRLIDFEHLIYPHENIEQTYIGNYRQASEWDRMMLKHGFVAFGFTMTKGETYYYTQSYLKM